MMMCWELEIYVLSDSGVDKLLRFVSKISMARVYCVFSKIFSLSESEKKSHSLALAAFLTHSHSHLQV